MAAPEGFFLFENAVSEEAWKELRAYLGLETDGPTGDDVLVRDRRNGASRGANGAGSGASSAEMRGSDRDFDFDFDVDRNFDRIPWESTPVPQHRPVAQFGARYDYDTSAVVVAPASPAKNGNANGNDNGEGSSVPKVPDIFRDLLLRPFRDGRGKERIDTAIEMEMDMDMDMDMDDFEQCIVNVYRPAAANTNTNANANANMGSNIPWHIDDPGFGPVILVFTFGEARPLRMRRKKKDSDNDIGDCDGDGDCDCDSSENGNAEAEAGGLSHCFHNNHNSSSEHNDDNRGGGDGDKSDTDCSYRYFAARPPHRSCYVLSGPARHEWEHSVPTGSGWRVSITFRTLANAIAGDATNR